MTNWTFESADSWSFEKGIVKAEVAVKAPVVPSGSETVEAPVAFSGHKDFNVEFLPGDFQSELREIDQSDYNTNTRSLWNSSWKFYLRPIECAILFRAR